LHYWYKSTNTDAAEAQAAEESGADKDRTSKLFQGQLQKAKEIQALQESLEHAAATAAAAAAAAADKAAALAAEKTATEERAAAAEAAAGAQAEALKQQLESKDRALKEVLTLLALLVHSTKVHNTDKADGAC